MIECLHGMHETLASIPNTAKIKKKLKIKKREWNLFFLVFLRQSPATLPRLALNSVLLPQPPESRN